MVRKREIIAGAKRKTRKITNPNSIQTQIDNFIVNCVERNLKPITVDGYALYLTLLKTFLESNGHSLLVDEIMEEDIKSYLFYLRIARKVSQVTINTHIANLKPFFNYVVNQGIIEESPMSKIKKVKTDKKPIKPFTNEQLKLLINQPDKSTFAGYRDYCVMLVLADTGMRISECLNLLINNISFNESRILLRIFFHEQHTLRQLR